MHALPERPHPLRHVKQIGNTNDIKPMLRIGAEVNHRRTTHVKPMLGIGAGVKQRRATHVHPPHTKPMLGIGAQEKFEKNSTHSIPSGERDRRTQHPHCVDGP